MRLRSITPLLALAILTGCATHYGPWSRKVAGFSTPAPADLDRMAALYPSANAVHILEEEAELVNAYPTQGYHPGQLKDFIIPEEIEARTQAIDALKSYTTLVGDLVLGKREEAESAKTKALTATKTATATASASSSKTAKTLTQAQMNYALFGLDFVLREMVEHKVQKQLPHIIAQADPSVQQICMLLEADIDTLRSQEAADYQQILVDQDQFIANNVLDPIAKQTLLMKLWQTEADAIAADQALVKEQDALKNLAKAHHALLGVK
jgi:hypothetical protein